MTKRRKDTRKRTEYHREYARRVREPKLKLARPLRTRQKAAWRAGDPGGFAVWWAQSGARWGHLEDAEGDVLLSGLTWLVARTIASAVRRLSPRPKRSHAGRGGQPVVRISSTGEVIRYRSISAAARENGVGRCGLHWSTYVDSDACAVCRGYADSADFSEFAGRSDYRGFTWTRICLCAN